MKSKIAVILCAVAGILPVAMLGWYSWDSQRNRGFEFGYFGEFNRIKHTLQTTPGLTITSEWANQDVSMEEFGFSVRLTDGKSTHLAISETDPIRNLSGPLLAAEVHQRLSR